MCMARVNVYLPDELALAVRPLDLNLSALVQAAVRQRLDTLRIDSWLSELATQPTNRTGHRKTLAGLGRTDIGTRGG